MVAGESCGTGSSSISGLAFTPQASTFPAAYNGALFFSDYSRDCIWAMLAGSNGLPDPANRQTFVSGAANPVELQFGPGGDLYYVDLDGGTIRRIRSLTSNRAPVARATATPSSGSVPLSVAFDGRTSSDPDGTPVTYAWDLDGDGQFDDSTSSTPSHTYAFAGTYTARLRVTDPGGLSDTVNVPITAGSPPVPVITITSPAPGTTWKVDDTISFSGTATDFLGAPIPASGLTWDINLQHCDRVSGSCHTHPLQSFGGVSGGSFPAPDHEFPSYLEIELTARDSSGLSGTATRRLDPRTVELTLASQPAGARLTLGGETATAPFTREVIEGSTNSIGTASPQTVAGEPYTFASWSNAGARNHTTVVDADTTLTASFERSVARRLAGTEAVNPSSVSVALPGRAEVYRTTAEASGTASELHLRLASTSQASALVLGLYADANGRPATLLGAGRIENPLAGAWNTVDVDIPGIQAGHAYWIALLNPTGSAGPLRWHDQATGASSEEEQSAGLALGQLPVSWATGPVWQGGPVSGFVFGPPAASPSPPPPSGLVGAWGFDEARGTTALDASGAGNRGRLSGPTRTAGRYGGGLSFDGAGDWVTVPDADSLDLTTGMTLEAWVRPSARGSTWRSVILKEGGAALAYGLYASSGPRPSGHVLTRGLRGPSRLPLNRWSHLAVTWDGLTIRVYVDGRLVSSGALAGVARPSSGPLRIGGNAIWPEWFRGLIDEVRVYDRALSAAEVARDRDARITPGAPVVKGRRPTRRAKVRETRRAVHRGTRWISGSGGAPRAG